MSKLEDESALQNFKPLCVRVCVHGEERVCRDGMKNNVISYVTELGRLAGGVLLVDFGRWPITGPSEDSMFKPSCEPKKASPRPRFS